MRFLVTRPQPDCKVTADRLRALGHDADEMPLLVFKPETPRVFELSEVRALAFTSRRAIQALEGHPQLSLFTSLPVFTVGDKTAEACRELGFLDVVSANADIHGLAELILASRGEFADGTVLYPAARIRSGDLAEQLDRGGLRCRTVPVYHMLPVDVLPEQIALGFRQEAYDGVLVFSRRTGETLSVLLKANGLGHIFSSLPIYAISTQAAETLESFDHVYISRVPREDALIELVLADC